MKPGGRLHNLKLALAKDGYLHHAGRSRDRSYAEIHVLGGWLALRYSRSDLKRGRTLYPGKPIFARAAAAIALLEDRWDVT